MEENAATTTPSPEPAPKKKSWGRRIFRFFLWTGGIFLVLLATAAVLGYVYREEVKSYVVAEINKHLNTQILVAPEDIDLTVIRSFPNASVEFRRVKALDAIEIPNRDTLFSAGRIGFEFNVWDLFSGNYRIRHIGAEEVRLNVWVDKNGRDNYHFLKPSSDTAKSDTAHASFALESIELSDVKVRYRDRRSNTDYKIDLKKSTCSGDFSSDNFTLSTQAEFFVHHIKQDSSTRLAQKNGRLDVEAQVDAANSNYTLQKCALRLAELDVTASGTVSERGKETLLDLSVKGEDIDLPAALSLLPEKYRDDLRDLESEGKFLLDASVKGAMSETQTPVVKASFLTSEGTELSRKSGGASLQDVVVKGSFSNEPGNSEVNISAFSFRCGGSKLSGNWRMKDFEHPQVEASLDGHLALKDMQLFLQSDTVDLADGAVDVSVRTSGKPAEGSKFKMEDLRRFNTTGHITFAQTALHLKSSPFKADSVNGKMVFNGSDLEVEKLSGRLSGSDFELSGALRNLLPWLFSEDEDLSIDASLRSRRLDLNRLLTHESTSTKADTNYRLTFPRHLRLLLRTEIDRVSFRKFEASTVRGTVALRDRKLVADPILFSTMDGAVSGSGMIDAGRGDTLLITCDAKILKVNIRKLFADLENFGQDELQDKHLRGALTADVKFASLWGADLEANLDKIYARGEVMIERGELIGFEPMKALSDHIKVEELEHIKFATLKNQVEIRDSKVIIPSMDIESSAMNITMSGTHDFSNMIDYRFRIRMDEIMARKAKNAHKQNEEFGQVEDDGGRRFSLYLSMTGHIDNPVIKYDRKSAVQRVKEDLKDEKKNLKQVLHDEFGWFKKDSAVRQREEDPKKKKDEKKEKKGDEGKFIIKWDEAGKGTEEEDEDF